MATQFFVYILRTSSNTLYVGQTNNLQHRLKQHLARSSVSAKYLRGFSSFRLVYYELQPSRSDALRRELEIKKWPKHKKELLIASSSSILTLEPQM